VSWTRTLLVAGLLVSRQGRADHDQHIPLSAEDPPSFGASVSLIAARFDTMLYGGDYQGVIPAMSWSRGRIELSAGLPLYRVQKNGRVVLGLGDAVAVARYALVQRPWRAGVGLALSAPTGDRGDGLGMGHAMVMPAAWATRASGPFTAGASVGYGRAIAAGSGHDHGAWPLVDPMTLQEVTWAASGELALVRSRRVRIGARVSGAIPFGATGDPRVIGATRIGWTAGRVNTGFELQVGLAGDPFTVRGVVETMLAF